MKRNIQYKIKDKTDNENFEIPWVSTYGQASTEVKCFSKKVNVSMKDFEIFDTRKKVVQPVFRKGKSLANQLFSQKLLTLSGSRNSNNGNPTVRCTDPLVVHRGRRCDACPMMGNVPVMTINRVKLHLAGGNCKTALLIYFSICSECKKPYSGKTINSLRDRISGHRSHMKEMINANDDLLIDDNNCLAAHAYFKHNVTDNKGFNHLYKFSIAEILSDPSIILRREQYYMNKYKTFVPFGLNVSNPIGLKALLLTS